MMLSTTLERVTIDGELIQVAGTVTKLKAKWGTYDQKKDILELYERIDIDGSDGMKALLTQATVFPKESRVTSDQPVQASNETSTIRANTMTINSKLRNASFLGDVEVVLGQARLALVEVSSDTSNVVGAHLTVEVLVDAVQDLGAVAVTGVGVVGHDSSWVPKPRSRAYSVSSARSWRRPRCSRDMTVPIGVSMISAISL